MPSILAPSLTDGPFSSDQANTPNTGASTPLNPLSINGLPGTTIANSSITRLAHPGVQAQRTGSPSMLGSQAQQSYMTNSAPTTPAASAAAHLHHQRHHRESSTGALNDVPINKRRRLNPHLGSLPATSSALARGSSLGPGTPKAGTPSASGIRSGSAGPRAAGFKKANGAAGASSRKLAPHQQIRKKAGARIPLHQAQSRKGSATKRQAGPGVKVAPSDEESMLSEDGISTPFDETGSAPRSHGHNTQNGTHAEGATTVIADGTSTSNTGTAGRKSSIAVSAQHNKLKRERATEDDDEEEAGYSDGEDEDAAVEDDERGEDDEDEEEEEEEDEAADDKKYCTCQNVSFGNMVACDNDDCPYEWFHWQCVGMTKEPAGKWYCDECTAKLGIKD